MAFVVKIVCYEQLKFEDLSVVHAGGILAEFFGIRISHLPKWGGNLEGLGQ
jgi:hypothetical protein